MKANAISARGAIWLEALTRDAPPRSGFPRSVRVVDGGLGQHTARYIAVVPDAGNPYARVRNGEVGLREAWEIARAVREIIDADRGRSEKRAIVAVVDVTSQAYGRLEEAYGIHQGLAGAADAYATARLEGHPVIGLIVGRAMSGAFLAHGYQANRLIALSDPQVMVHAMGKASAARVTQRTVAELETLTADIAPMAYDIESYASLGLLWKLLRVAQPDAPTPADLQVVEQALIGAYEDIKHDTSPSLAGRLDPSGRPASVRVREKLRAQWK